MSFVYFSPKTPLSQIWWWRNISELVKIVRKIEMVLLSSLGICCSPFLPLRLQMLTEVQWVHNDLPSIICRWLHTVDSSVLRCRCPRVLVWVPTSASVLEGKKAKFCSMWPWRRSRDSFGDLLYHEAHPTKRWDLLWHLVNLGVQSVSLGLFVLATCPEEEEQLSRMMMAYWGNFARTG